MLKKFSSSAILALEKLNNSGFEAYFIGGSVRDALMSKDLGDIDITTNATPENVKKVFSEFRVIDTGIKHGTVTVLIGSTPIEITTYRSESGYSDNRHPDKVEFSNSFIDDVVRRDFTMNGIGLSLDGKIRDEVGGKKDIDEKIIRAIGDPVKRFREDALRILRAIRFASCLGFTIEENTKNAIHSEKELLNNISKERILVELKKLLCGDNAESVLLEYSDVLAVFIPELKTIIGFDQKNRHHIFDVYTHSVKALQNAPKTPEFRVALLLHDLGKPVTAKADENDELHFKHHPAESEKVARKILDDLRFSNAEKEAILNYIRFHGIKLLKKGEDGKPKFDEDKIKHAFRDLGIDLLLEVIEIKRCDNTSKNPKFYLGDEFFEQLKNATLDIFSKGEAWSIAELDIDGNDLITLGIKGKKISETLNRLLDEVIFCGLTNKKDKLIEKIKK